MRSLRFKILAVAAALVLLTQLGTVTTVLVTASRDVTSRATESLDAAGRALEQVSRGRAGQLGSVVSVLAADYAFKQAVATRETDTIQSALANHGQRAGADLALLLDEQGRVLVAAGSRLPEEGSFARLVAQSTTDGVAHTTIITRENAYDVLTVPVRAPLPVAWVAMGFAITDRFARDVATISGLDVAFVTRTSDGPHVVASSLPAKARRALESAPGSLEGEAVRIELAGEQYLARQRPFVHGNSDISVVLMESLDEAMAPFRLLRTAAIVLGAVPLLMALAGAVLLSRAITRPVAGLVAAVRRINMGDYSRSVPTGSGDELAEFAGAFNTMQDGIAERERRIVFQLHHDALTGLPNRTLALQTLTTALERAGGAGAPLSVVVLGLDAVGEISASLGHEIGDAFLRQVGERLQMNLAAGQTLARLEGDEFVLILEGAEARDAQNAVLRLCEGLEAGLYVGDVSLNVRPAIGVAVFPEHGTAADDLLQRAATARVEATRALDRIRVYEPGGEQRHARQLAILGDLRRAVNRDELQLYLQPKISLQDSRVCGAEALVRWDHPTLGWLPPGDFIPVAEKSGNIGLITRWALCAALRECRLWQEDGLDLPVAVNLSSQDLVDARLPEYIMGLLRDHDLEPRHLVVEITEEAIVRDFSHATLVLRYLRDLGIRIAIDDFGTGYSSLAQIKNLPVDEIKIDRSFVQDLPHSREDTAIVRATIDLAANLGLKVVAEGAETLDSYQWLAAQGCAELQGFLISRPMPAAKFAAWVRDFRVPATRTLAQVQAPARQAG